MAHAEQPVDVAFWPGPEHLRWWTVQNRRGERQVLRVDVEIEEIRVLIYLVLPSGAWAHPPLAASLLRLGEAGFKALEERGALIIFAVTPDGAFTQRGLVYESLFCPETADSGQLWTYEDPVETDA